jgi:hypothetical protein
MRKYRVSKQNKCNWEAISHKIEIYPFERRNAIGKFTSLF